MTPAQLDAWLREHLPASRLRWITYRVRGKTCVTLEGPRRRVRHAAGMLLSGFGADLYDFPHFNTRFEETWKAEL